MNIKQTVSCIKPGWHGATLAQVGNADKHGNGFGNSGDRQNAGHAART
jgi:hypothetical protein